MEQRGPGYLPTAQGRPSFGSCPGASRLQQNLCSRNGCIGVWPGAVLMQEHHPIAFISKAISAKQQTLSVYEKELPVILMAVKQWHYYLILRPFIIKTDQRSLKHLLTQKLRMPYHGCRGLPCSQQQSPRDSNDEEVDEVMPDREATTAVLKQSLQRAQNRMKQQADRHRTDREFEKVTWVGFTRRFSHPPGFSSVLVEGSCYGCADKIVPIPEDARFRLKPEKVLGRKLVKRGSRAAMKERGCGDCASTRDRFCELPMPCFNKHQLSGMVSKGENDHGCKRAVGSVVDQIKSKMTLAFLIQAIPEDMFSQLGGYNEAKQTGHKSKTWNKLSSQNNAIHINEQKSYLLVTLARFKRGKAYGGYLGTQRRGRAKVDLERYERSPSNKPEEGEDDVKSSCPLCPGRHTCYNGRDKGHTAVNPFPGLVHTARHTMGAGHARSCYLNRKEGDAEGRASDWSEVVVVCPGELRRVIEGVMICLERMELYVKVKWMEL
ncbi:hypothetical protein E3N88_09511 [Mikania micrantha]|uniref:Reverse transcriptase RNase H-like domain-containing protein n=1 Tax=Mikania micrantha TaxID=192012 RepID=A0A5N6PMC3_9ASTR|nr:hypothetical protein E3N88_09511 [Mikania micrantha]